MQRVARGGDRWIWGLALGCLLAAGTAARAGDVTTLSGQTFRDVRVVHVDPDGVTWQHATGMAKVDFTDLPEPVRRAYHYDAKKAAAFQAAQVQAQQQAAAQAQQDKRNLDARRAQRFHEQSAANTTDEAGATPGFSFHAGYDRAVEIAAQAIGEQTEARKAAQARLTEFDGTIWDRRLWMIPCLFFGGYSGGHRFDRPPPPPTDFGGGVDYSGRSWTQTVIREEGF